MNKVTIGIVIAILAGFGGLVIVMSMQNEKATVNTDGTTTSVLQEATDANGNPLSGWDTNPGTFHGGDFAGVTKSIEEGYFDNLGVNALWISAPYEQIHGYCDSGKGFAHYSYHGYYVLDYTETDKNFGTAEEFQTLVDTAHKHGIRVIMDIVMNHSGYNTVKDMEEYNFGTLLSGASDFKYKLNGVSEVNSHIDFKSSAADWGRWWGNDRDIRKIQTEATLHGHLKVFQTLELSRQNQFQFHSS